MSHSSTARAGGRSRSLILTAMIFAVAMTFIDQTIVSIAAPTIQHALGLSSSGMQWAINSYLLALAALFAFGGRLADIAGHRKMVVIGVIIFAGASALCGATPAGGAAEAWLVAFRAVQGLGGAIMFPAAIAIVVQTFDLRSRGRALALFFGLAGALTAIGPILGGYLIEWTWRAIFWINIPVALIAQEVSGERHIAIPDEVLDVYRLWRPTPLLRARRLEKDLGTPARIYYKYEGGSPAGSGGRFLLSRRAPPRTRG